VTGQPSTAADNDGGSSGTALVLAGGGARGAYEAGALSIILPALTARGERPTIYVGTSVGAINGAALASSHHLPVDEQVEVLLSIWRSITRGDVMRRILMRSGPLDLLRFAGQLVSLPGIRLVSLLDPSPLWGNLARWMDIDQLHANVDDGSVDCAAVVATSARSGRTVVFVDSATPKRVHRSHAVAYVPARLSFEHIGASAAIPLLWPPVKVTEPQRARGWYVDGGTRLNTPIKPALDLGAKRLVVVAVDSIVGPVMEPDDEADDLPPPDLGDGMLQLLEGTLVDPLIEDLRTLGNVNEFFAGSEISGPRMYRMVRGKGPYRTVPYIFVGPERRGVIGEIAAEVFARRYGGLKRLRSLDLALLNELVGGVSHNHAELLSLLFFDPAFADALIQRGQQDARAWLDAEHDADGPWQQGPLEAFTGPRQWTVG
jgi:NTE family protein